MPKTFLKNPLDKHISIPIGEDTVHIKVYGFSFRKIEFLFADTSKLNEDVREMRLMISYEDNKDRHHTFGITCLPELKSYDAHIFVAKKWIASNLLSQTTLSYALMQCEQDLLSVEKIQNPKIELFQSYMVAIE